MGSQYLWKPLRTLRQACRSSSIQGRNCLFCELADRCLRDARDGADTAAAAAEPLVQDVMHDGRVQSPISSLGSPKPELSR